MNLLEILRARARDLPEGDYTPGIKAVLQHIEVATRHLERGQTRGDDTAFTDAIYRANQAFEGSLKEAFRVLAGGDPAGERPYDIENYLQQQNVLRPRVLAQLTNYRREWRNPSTHDYRLDFDEDEALLAIVTVSAFAIVLIDQITERVSFEQAKTAAIEQPSTISSEPTFFGKVSTLIHQFIIQFEQTRSERTEVRETEIKGALAGFLSAAAPELDVNVEGVLSPESPLRADFLITSKGERLIVEIKRGRRFTERMKEDATQQVLRYMEISGIKQAILLIYNSENSRKEIHTTSTSTSHGGFLSVIVTK